VSGRRMAPGGAVSAACLALLSTWRFADGQLGWALVLAVAAVVVVVLSLRRGAAVMSAGVPARASAGAAAGAGPDQDRVRRTWWVIGAAGLVSSLLAAPVFPPLALVLAGCAVYAAHSARRTRYPA